jgi:2-keto-3-deoxy-6-phosphogluconate aldolase
LEGVIKISDLGKLFVTIGSKFEKDGFDKARQSIDMLAKAALGMGTVFVAAALKSAQAAGEQERASVQLAQAMLTAGKHTNIILIMRHLCKK